MVLQVKGKNIHNYIKRLYNHHIELLDIKYLDIKTVLIKIYRKDYDEVIKCKTTYEIEEKGYAGLISYLYKLNINKYIIIFILLGLSVIIFLSRIIFTIEIISNDNQMKKKILDELKNNGLKVYQFKKNYQELQNIKKKILEKYKQEIDWIEIENIGTKYIIRYEPRLQNKEEKNNTFRNIIAKKDAIIYNLDISNGQIIKGKNTYVKKGDIIVSGYIYLNDSIKDTVVATGKVYGEVWYNVTVTYPLIYKETKLTGNHKKVYVLSFLGHQIELFNFHKYKDKNIKKKELLKNNILPFSMEWQVQYETKIINENNTVEQAIDKAIEVGTDKIESNLSDGEFILKKEVINSTSSDEDVTVKIFYSVIEEITDYQEISEYNENEVLN